MSRADIMAGKAYVELTIKNSKFLSGMKQISDKMKATGVSIAQFGTKIMGIGATVGGALGGAVKHFASLGDEIGKGTKRMNVSVQAFQELSHAAKEGGTDIGTVENGLRNLQNAAGSGVDFKLSGLKADDLLGKSGDEQIQAAADAINAIEDPTKRAAAAMEIFGRRNGTAMLPMLEGLRASRDEFKKFGLALDDGEVKTAEELSDSFGALRTLIGQTVAKIGSALAPVIIKITDSITEVAASAGRWIAENKQVIVTIAKVAAGVTAAGAVITALGVSIAGAGVVLGGITTGLAAMGVAIGAILSPIGLVAAGLTTGVVLWARYTDSGKAAVKSLSDLFTGLAETFKKTFKGISDAMMMGDLTGAWNVAMAGLKLGGLQTLDFLQKSFLNVLDDIGNLFGVEFKDILKGIGEFAKGFVELVSWAADKAIGIWQSMANTAANLFIDMFYAGDLQSQDAMLARANAKLLSEYRKNQVRDRKELEAALASGDEERIEKARATIANRAEIIQQAGISTDSVKRAKEETAAVIKGFADGAKESVTDMTNDMIAQIDAAMERAGGPDRDPLGIKGSIVEAREELTRLLSQIDQAKKNRDAKVARDKRQAELDAMDAALMQLIEAKDPAKVAGANLADPKEAIAPFTGTTSTAAFAALAASQNGGNNPQVRAIENLQRKVEFEIQRTRELIDRMLIV
jgi:TP901 family phage tail tape measure protein